MGVVLMTLPLRYLTPLFFEGLASQAEDGRSLVWGWLTGFPVFEPVLRVGAAMGAARSLV